MINLRSEAEYKKTEKWLYNYKNIENYITQLELKILHIKNDIVGCGAIRYDDIRVSPTNDIKSTVEMEVINKQEEIEELEAKKKGLQIQKDRLDTAINNLNSDQKILFNLVYINNSGWSRNRIIDEMHISKDTYYRLKKSIVYSAMNSLNPDRALREIEEMYR